jgi:hypothetical protein
MARTVGSRNKMSGRDPLLNALIDKLPPPGVWPANERSAWLKMMAMAFDVVYGAAEGGVEITRNGKAGLIAGMSEDEMERHAESTKPADPPFSSVVRTFFIDREGFARGPGGVRIVASQVDGRLYDLRGEGDLGSIVWADGSTGVLGKQLDIAAA